MLLITTINMALVQVMLMAAIMTLTLDGDEHGHDRECEEALKR